MAAGTTLTRLLRELKKAHSPVDRMRLLARAWRSLRRLRPEERKLLATQVGMEGAEEILEGLGRGEKRLAPVLVMQALEAAKKDPSRLRGLVKDLKDRDRRGELLQRWLDSVAGSGEDQAVDGDSAQPTEQQAAPHAEQATTTAGPPPREERGGPGRPRAVPVAPPPLPRSPAEVAAPEPAKAAPPPPAGAQPTGPPAAPAGHREVAPATASQRPQSAAAASGVPSSPASGARPAPARAAPAAVSTSPTSGASSLPAKLQGTPRLMTRFRLLRAGLEENGGRLSGEATEILEAFPAGWARRRALDALLRHRIPASLDRALELIDELESPGARRWCLRTVMEHWELGVQQRARVQEARSR